VPCSLATALLAAFASAPRLPGLSPSNATSVPAAASQHRSLTTRPIVADLREPDGRGVTLAATTAKPLSLAGGDFNHDGFPDFVAGYATGRSGLLTVHLASQEAFAPQSPKSISGIAMGDFPQAFTDTSVAIRIPAAPDFLAVGDFDHDGNMDILFAARDGNQFYILPGDGAGNFGAARAFPVTGRITAIAAPAAGSGGSGANLVVGVRDGSGATLLVYGRSLGAPPLRRQPSLESLCGWDGKST